MIRLVFGRQENILGKGGNAENQCILLFNAFFFFQKSTFIGPLPSHSPTMFSKSFILGFSKHRIAKQWVRKEKKTNSNSCSA